VNITVFRELCGALKPSKPDGSESSNTSVDLQLIQVFHVSLILDWNWKTLCFLGVEHDLPRDAKANSGADSRHYKRGNHM
jgi:hypothetical protein